MQSVKIIISLIVFYFLAVFQASYLIHFKIVGGIWNPILVAIIFLNFFEKYKDKSGLVMGGLAGFYLDLFSSYFFGFFTLIGILVAFAIKSIKPLLETKRFISFALVLFSCLLFYEISITLAMVTRGLSFNVFSIIINFLAGIIIYWTLRLFNVPSRKKIR
ncbi:hypothetical protein KJ562_02700 [Patescibacteria group bacterium]|nr:hypothetical protein [Patescibacteria group bacterium]MBU4162212.1 hypothetical protein [Patescibacteria group bacterium]